MDSAYLRALLRKYNGSVDSPDPLTDIQLRERSLRRTRLLDLGAQAVALSVVDRDEVSKVALRAIEDTNPAFDPARLAEYSDTEWMGMVSTAKGRYFEYLVVDELNKGEAVGDLYLPDGYRAELASSPTQAGWDVSIVDRYGEQADLLQLKASESAAYIKDALDRYPEIQILATSEVAESLQDSNMVLDSGMSETELQRSIEAAFNSTSPAFLDEFWAAFNPLLPLLVIAASQGYSIAVGRQRARAAAISATSRAERAVVVGLAGALAKVATDSFLVALPVTVATSYLFDRAATLTDMRKEARTHASRQRQRVRYYEAISANGAT